MGFGYMGSQKVKIFAPLGHGDSRDYRNFLIHPIRAFWGDGTNDWINHEATFNFYKKYIELVDNIKLANAVFLPYTLNYYIKNKQLDVVKYLCELSVNNNLVCYIWLDGDADVKINFPGSVVLKNSSHRSLGMKNEIIRPGDVKIDILQKEFHGDLNSVVFSVKPSIGFDGLATYKRWRLLALIARNCLLFFYNHIRNFEYYSAPVIPWLVKRHQLLEMLKQDSEIFCDFTERSEFASGTHGKKMSVRMEFLNNIRRNHYTLCIRGSANYSLRFYETMCLGRIPLLIDTDCKLPCEDVIDWRNLIPIVPYSKKNKLKDLLLVYHNQLDSKEFINRQEKCRAIYEEYLSPEGFFKYVVDKIKKENII
jgi:hypothetical protein